MAARLKTIGANFVSDFGFKWNFSQTPLASSSTGCCKLLHPIISTTVVEIISYSYIMSSLKSCQVNVHFSHEHPLPCQPSACKISGRCLFVSASVHLSRLQADSSLHQPATRHNKNRKNPHYYYCLMSRHH